MDTFVKTEVSPFWAGKGVVDGRTGDCRLPAGRLPSCSLSSLQSRGDVARGEDGELIVIDHNHIINPLQLRI